MVNKKRITMNQKLRGDRIYYWAFLAYPIIHFLIFYLYVNFDSFLLAFQRYDVPTKTYNFSDPLYNFNRFFSEFNKNNVLVDGIIMNFVNYAFRLLIIIPFVLYMSFVLYKKVPGTNFFRIMLYLPMMISSTVWVLLYEFVSETMLPNIVQLTLGEYPGGFLSNDSTALGMLLYFQMWYSVGGSTLMYISAMSGIPEEQVEAMQMDGAGSIREFVHLTLPSIWPILVENNVLTIAIYVANGKVEVNGVDTKLTVDFESLFDTTNRTSASLSFDARNSVLTVCGNTFKVEDFVRFTNDIAVLKLAVKGVSGETEFSVRKICNQVLKSTTRKDGMDPILSYDGIYGIYMERDSVLTVYKAVVCDVLSPIKANYVSVYNPDGSVATAIDGTVLNKVPSNRDYQVLLSKYGTYVIDYFVIDDADNNPPLASNVQVVDNQPPVIKVKDTFPKTAKVGDVIRIPEYQVSDDVDKDLTVTIILYNDFDGLRRIWTDEYFVINEVADYCITFISYDSAGNTASLTITIKVEG